MCQERKFDTTVMIAFFGVFGLIISAIQDERYFRKLNTITTITRKEIDITERNVFVRSETNPCHVNKIYSCDEMIRWKYVGGCWDPVNVSCLGYYHWINDHGYQQTVFYPEGSRNLKARSVIMEKKVWDINITCIKYTEVCEDWSCFLEWNRTEKINVVINLESGKITDVKEYTSLTTLFFNMIVFISLIHGIYHLFI